MSEIKIYEVQAKKEREQRGEIYVLAAKNPLLVWRLQALRAGYTPPLLLGKIPPEMAKIQIGPTQEEYTIDPLAQHAARVRKETHSYFQRAFTLFVTLMLVICILGFIVRMKMGSSFRVGFLESIVPRVTSEMTLR